MTQNDNKTSTEVKPSTNQKKTKKPKNKNTNSVAPKLSDKDFKANKAQKAQDYLKRTQSFASENLPKLTAFIDTIDWKDVNDLQTVNSISELFDRISAAADMKSKDWTNRNIGVRIVQTSTQEAVDFINIAIQTENMNNSIRETIARAAQINFNKGLSMSDVPNHVQKSYDSNLALFGDLRTILRHIGTLYSSISRNRGRMDDKNLYTENDLLKKMAKNLSVDELQGLIDSKTQNEQKSKKEKKKEKKKDKTPAVVNKTTEASEENTEEKVAAPVVEAIATTEVAEESKEETKAVTEETTTEAAKEETKAVEIDPEDLSTATAMVDELKGDELITACKNADIVIGTKKVSTLREELAKIYAVAQK